MATPAGAASNKSAAYDYLIKLLLIGDSGKYTLYNILTCALCHDFFVVWSLHVGRCWKELFTTSLF